MAVDPRRVKELFVAALELDEAQARQHFLDRACGSDAELRQRLDVLLRAHDDPASVLNRPLAEVAPGEPGTTGTGGLTPPTVEDPSPSEVVGALLAGRYQLLQPLGEGGMGTVWMAEQTEPVKRLAALKFIKAGMDSKQVLARFEQERQALALMDHPHIAKVFDAGTAPDGRPFFVMELVQGVPITQYCDEHRLTPRQRLELFIPVCQAVQHAHQKGIIHRDLKPSNVLVALYDGKPVPKVIDFGVAKAAGQALTDKTLVTDLGAIVGTLEYMSPEQAEINQLDIDTRSDIYALGVLLYELLTGGPPFSRQEMGTGGLLEMLRVIRQQEPTKPSAKLSTAEGLPTLAANRGTEPAKLARLLRGELDWIALKALEKDRNRRYDTANAFAQDVQHYLVDEPVVACPPSPGYRLRKFVRRNRGPVVAAGVILLCLVAGIVGTTAGLVWAVRERDDKARALRAETNERKAKERALVEETRARESEKQGRDRAMAALRDMTDDIVEKLMMARGPDLTEENKEFLRKIIKHFEGIAAVPWGDTENRVIRAEGIYCVGFVQYRLGELKEAEAAFTAALALYKQLTADYPARSVFRHLLAKSHYSLSLLLDKTGRLKEAERACGNALALQKRLVADFPTRPEFARELSNSHNHLGLLLAATGRVKEAEAAHGDALALQKRLAANFPSRPEFRKDLAASHNNLGILLTSTGRMKEAEAALGAARALFKQLATKFPARFEFRRDLARSHNNLGTVLSTTGRMKEAEVAYGAALALFKQLAADFPSQPEFRQGLAKTHYNLGILIHHTSRRKEAEAAYGDALALFKRLGTDFPDRPEFRWQVAQCHNNLGSLLEGTGLRKEAEVAYGAALALFKQLAKEFPTRPEFRQGLAISHNNLGRLYGARGLRKEAEVAHGAALALRKQLAADFPSRPEFRRDLAASHNALGVLFSTTGRRKEAEIAYADALALFKQLAADLPNNPGIRNRLAGTFVNLALLRLKQRAFKAAKAYLDEARPHHKAALKANPRHSEYRQHYRNNLATLIVANAGLGDPAGAKQAAEQLRDLGGGLSSNAYDAARCLVRCIPLVRGDARAPEEERDQQAAFYGDEAMKLLRDSVARGYRDAAHMGSDVGLAPLRQRDDFKKLLAELQAKK
jgi:serine/threonine protein kinase/Flp pilus assembly protein TadD